MRAKKVLILIVAILFVFSAKIFSQSTVITYLALHSPIEKYRYWAVEDLYKREINSIQRTSFILLAISGDGPVAKYALELLSSSNTKIDPEVAVMGLLMILRENELEIDVSRGICYTIVMLTTKHKKVIDISGVERSLSELKRMERSLYFRGEIDFALYNLKDIKDCVRANEITEKEIR